MKHKKRDTFKLKTSSCVCKIRLHSYGKNYFHCLFFINRHIPLNSSLDYRVGLKHNAKNRVSFNFQYHSVVNSSVINSRTEGTK